MNKLEYQREQNKINIQNKEAAELSNRRINDAKLNQIKAQSDQMQKSHCE